MLKFKPIILAATLGILLSGAANATTLTDTLGEVSFNGNAPFPSLEQVVGTFQFLVPIGDGILSASVAGTFGNNAFPDSTANFDLFGDGVLLGKCDFTSVGCFNGPIPFEFTITDLSTLLDGELVLSFIQQSENITRLGATTLTVLTAPSVVPLPAALPLFGTGLAFMGFIGWRRKRKVAAAA